METKSPAVLWYTSDFLTGTNLMSDEQLGKYTRALCYQHQQGHLAEEDMLTICKTYDEKIYSKFIKDKDGKYYNKRMDIEIEKRNNFSKSRSLNRRGKPNKNSKKQQSHMNNISKSYEQHMDNENDNDNDNIYKNIIDYLNNKTSRNYNYKSKKNIEVIKARLNEGYTFEDFKKVIDIKTKKWLNNEWNIYLRPETLFSNKFDGYLNEKVENEQKPNCFKEVKKEEVELTDEQRRELEEIEAKIRG